MLGVLLLLLLPSGPHCLMDGGDLGTPRYITIHHLCTPCPHQPLQPNTSPPEQPPEAGCVPGRHLELSTQVSLALQTYSNWIYTCNGKYKPAVYICAVLQYRPAPGCGAHLHLHLALL